MDKAILVSIIVMVIIAAIEVGCLLCCAKIRMKGAPVVAVLPLFREDDELVEKLEYLENVLLRPSSEIDILLLINFGCTDEQLTVCKSFCRRIQAAEIVSVTDLEKNLSETFAISHQI